MHHAVAVWPDHWKLPDGAMFIKAVAIEALIYECFGEHPTIRLDCVDPPVPRTRHLRLANSLAGRSQEAVCKPPFWSFMVTLFSQCGQAVLAHSNGLAAKPGRATPNVLDLVQLTPLMKLTRGRREIAIGLIDGPVLTDHTDLAGRNIRQISGRVQAKCAKPSSVACSHGTFVAGVLCAERTSVAPAICPDCTLLVRPIFSETTAANDAMPSATPEDLANAVVECIDRGARLLNLSVGLEQEPSGRSERVMGQALDYAFARGVIIVAAAGNYGSVGSTSITRHQSVIPVIACDRSGRPLDLSNLGNGIARRGLSAPGAGVASLSTQGKAPPAVGTSVAAPFVTGAIGLLWSEFPTATAWQLRVALAQAHPRRRPTVVPELLNAWGTYQALSAMVSKN
jgi:subtilisin family serine protease